MTRAGKCAYSRRLRKKLTGCKEDNERTKDGLTGLTVAICHRRIATGGVKLAISHRRIATGGPHMVKKMLLMMMKFLMRRRFCFDYFFNKNKI